MTTIIATQTAIYSDSLVTEDGKQILSPKLYRIGKSIFGIAGDCKSEGMFLEWYPRRHNHEIPNYVDSSIDILEINSRGMFFWNNGNRSFKIDTTFYSIGTGAKYALTAMYLGKTPEEALQVATALDINTGGALQVLQFKNGRRKSANSST